jgi:hypothetical protein
MVPVIGMTLKRGARKTVALRHPSLTPACRR